MPVVVLETWIAAPIEACYELSLSVDAHTASMGGSNEQAVAGVTSGVMRLDDSVTWRAKHFGLTFKMTSRITEVDAPTRFVDEQVTGPFRSWRHEHRFVAADGGITMFDTVEFESPAGFIGTAVNRLILTRYMTHLLESRNRWLRDALTATSR
jgi:ligand-binding SRPBCC domain-containing protein